MNDFKTLTVFILALVLLAALVSRMNGETLALLGALVFLFFMCSKRIHSNIDDDTSHSQNDGMDGSDESAQAAPVVTEPNVMTKPTDNPPDWVQLDDNQRPAEPTWTSPNDATLARIKKSNQLAVREVFGRRYGGTMDNALYKHKQRIGDRDRQATINQIRARRNNVYEPYYRQELAEAERSRGWWNNDDILTTKLDHHQLATIDMGRFNGGESDMDGIYST
jgi:Ca2+/Na+ antiporter